MKITISITSNFKKSAKPLLKKYNSLKTELLVLEKDLIQNPHMGISLGNNAYKIRIKIASKQKGKSGGARIITLVESNLLIKTEKVSETETIVYLVSIFDKSEVENIPEKELKVLIKNIR
jgi:mRNA-degrading endonuclease RelE of RelBE toxin-antitoxin system